MRDELVDAGDVPHVALRVGVDVHAGERWREDAEVDRVVVEFGDPLDAVAEEESPPVAGRVVLLVGGAAVRVPRGVDAADQLVGHA